MRPPSFSPPSHQARHLKPSLCDFSFRLCLAHGFGCSLSSLAPLEAILFDIDGTLCDSDPFHYHAFYEMLQEVSFNGGVPITEEFFMEKIHGKHNDQLCGILFPDWDFERAIKFMNNKEAMFRRLAAENLQPLNGLKKLCQWIEDRSLKRAAVTNAPRPNAELLISMLSLADFFEIVILGNECERAKPFPDPYLKGLRALEVSPKHTFAFEDSVSGIKARGCSWDSSGGISYKEH
ncbi:haloacid dehalogenase-like hydrolase (HAD) superfamily protein [Actinidia rufa]|uniref:Haloacid dehalogenase-like hydrolase (HAD) superfamily protein n=1 Tax=Actinidia rufa TaxID=165716 RepID=A0A7J0F050_9ERIC|nr:haloacid dehalogenase-like hydrolase (HAD) superfamily protein [Actinidia rufa]